MKPTVTQLDEIIKTMLPFKPQKFYCNPKKLTDSEFKILFPKGAYKDMTDNKKMIQYVNKRAKKLGLI